MAELKTKPTGASVTEFLNGIDDEKKRQDAFTILELLREVTRSDPKMWGSAIIGFGDIGYQYASGRKGDWFLTGFSPRKQNLTIYITGGFEAHSDLLSKLGKYKSGSGCLYINKLKDIDLSILRALVRRSVEEQTAQSKPIPSASTQ